MKSIKILDKLRIVNLRYIETLLLILFSSVIIFTRWGYYLIFERDRYVPLRCWDAGSHITYAEYAKDYLWMPNENTFGLLSPYNFIRTMWLSDLRNEYFAYFTCLPDLITGYLMRLNIDWAVATALIVWISEIMTMLILFDLIKRKVNRFTAIISVFLFSFSILNIWALHETMIYFSVGNLFFISALWVFERWEETKNKHVLSLFPILILLSTHCHPFYIFAVIVFLLPIFFVEKISKKINLKELLLVSLLIFLGVVLNTRVILHLDAYLDHFMSGGLGVPLNTVIQPGWRSLNFNLGFLFGITSQYGLHEPSWFLSLQAIAMSLIAVILFLGFYKSLKEKNYIFAIPFLIVISIFFGGITHHSFYIINRYGQVYQLFLLPILAYGIDYLRNLQINKNKIINQIVVIGILFLIIVNGMLLVGMLLSNEKGMSKEFIQTADFIKQKNPDELIFLSRGGTSQTEVLAARSKTLTYDLSMKSLFDDDIKNGVIKNKATFLAVWCNEAPCPAPELKNINLTDKILDTKTRNGARILVGEMYVKDIPWNTE